MKNNTGTTDRLEMTKYMIATYYYCAVSNYYAFMSLPSASKYDEENNFHVTTRNILDLSDNDVNFMKNAFESLKITDEEIEESGLEKLYKEAVDIWIPMVKDSSTSFLKIEEYNKTK